MEATIDSHIKNRKCCRVVLFPLPIQGHINPMMQLANILYSNGFSIAIIHTHFNSPNPSNYPHFAFHPIPDGLLENEASTEDVIALLSVLNVNCIEPFRDCLAKLLLDGSSEEEEEKPIACLITDAAWHFSQAVADGLKLPRIVLRTSSVCSFLAFAAFDLFREKGYLPIQDSRLEERVQELPALKVKDLPVIQTRDPESLHQLLYHMVNQTKASSGLIWNSFEELEKPALTILGEDFPIPLFQVGPFHKHFPASSSSLLTQERGCMSWLDTQAPNSVLYVSFGSIASIKATEFQEIAWGLANSNQPFLWVIRPGLVRGTDRPEPLPDGFLETVGDRGHIVKWAPQQEVLAHSSVGGFWTHNGWNSTLESICEGVPMLCLPSFGDQMVNARYVSDVWRIGFHLERKLDRVEIAKAIKSLMVEAEGHELRERISKLKDKVDLCLGEDGSSYSSLHNLIDYVLSLKSSFNWVSLDF